MKKQALLCVILFSLTVTAALAQESYGYLDSLKRSVQTAKTDAARIARLEKLATFYMIIDRKQADVYSHQIQEIAEKSRDRDLMVKALVIDAARYYITGAGNRDDVDKARVSAERALELAKSSGLDGAEAEVYTVLALIARSKGESDKALNYNNLALSLVGADGNDSLRIDCLISLADTYMAKDERLQAFRNYLQALSIAEELGHYEPLMDIYRNLAGFYSILGEHEKAKDYLFKASKLTFRFKRPFDRTLIYREIGAVYTDAKQYDVATEYYEKLMMLSDSIQFDLFRVNGYLKILEQYLKSGQADKALTYLNSRTDLRDIMKRAGGEQYIYQTYGQTYYDLGRYDSAKYYYALAEPIFETKANPAVRFEFYIHQADLYSRLKQYDKSLAILQKANNIAKEIRDLGMKQRVAQAMDSTYQLLGDFKSAYLYNKQYNVYTDSLDLLATEKDLMVLEVANETKRREREEQKAEEELHARHNIQYMGITVAIVIVFMALAVLGIFRVSKTMIKALGFFAFIFLFEFIILLADNQIHHWTHGEPWKVMLIKIVLISLLLPLHHFLEEKVIHYLTSHHMLQHKDSLMSRLRRERVEDSEANAPS